MQKIAPSTLVPMDIFSEIEPITIDLVYGHADDPNNMFQEAIYHKNARLWLQYDMARIVVNVARIIHRDYGYTLELKDGLRTIDSQIRMQETKIAKENPQWMVRPRFLSPPGKGAHPYGMAIDVCVLKPDGTPLDMGTEFDEMTEKSSREYVDFPDEILQNRALLEKAFAQSSDNPDLPLLALPNEWWDFRFPEVIYTSYVPLRDSDLPPQMRMTTLEGPDIPDFPLSHFEALKKDILQSLN